jgi:hypothetical protein
MAKKDNWVGIISKTGGVIAFAVVYHYAIKPRLRFREHFEEGIL